MFSRRFFILTVVLLAGTQFVVSAQPHGMQQYKEITITIVYLLYFLPLTYLQDYDAIGTAGTLSQSLVLLQLCT
jgi:hypothetical protein